MTPFTPRPFDHPPEPASPDEARNDSICAVAAGLADPAERAAYLDATCGAEGEFRERMEKRVAERVAASPSDAASAPNLKLRAVPPVWKSAPVPADGDEKKGAPTSTDLVRVAEPQGGAHPSAVALVPMSARQLATATAPFRSNTFPWITATVLAAVVGALAVITFQEKEARQRAENVAEQARAASAAAERSRDEIAVRGEQTAAMQSQQLESARADSERFRKDSEGLRAESAELRAQASAHSQQALAARAESDKLRAELEEQRSPSAAQVTASPVRPVVSTAPVAPVAPVAPPTNAESAADRAAAVATENLEKRKYAEAEIAAREWLEILAAQDIAGWPAADAHSILGVALFQKNKDAEAGAEFKAVGDIIEPLGAPAAEPDKQRLAAISKRLLHFYAASGQRKTAQEWKRKLDTLAPR